MKLWSSLSLFALAASPLVAACENALPPATSPAASLSQPAPGQASVVFVRPKSTCDKSEYTVVVEANGRFVANVAAGTQVSVPEAPGRHVFYAWSSDDTLIERDMSWNPVGATEIHVGPADTRYVELEIAPPCQEYIVPDLRAVPPVGGLQADLPDWLASTKPVSVDREAGQLELLRQPAHLQVRLELGALKLRRLGEQRSRLGRHEVLQAENQ